MHGSAYLGGKQTAAVCAVQAAVSCKVFADIQWLRAEHQRAELRAAYFGHSIPEPMVEMRTDERFFKALAANP